MAGGQNHASSAVLHFDPPSSIHLQISIYVVLFGQRLIWGLRKGSWTVTGIIGRSVSSNLHMVRAN